MKATAESEGPRAECHGRATVLQTVVWGPTRRGDRKGLGAVQPSDRHTQAKAAVGSAPEVARDLLTSELALARPWQKDGIGSSLAKPQRTSALGLEGVGGGVLSRGGGLRVGRGQRGWEGFPQDACPPGPRGGSQGETSPESAVMPQRSGRSANSPPGSASRRYSSRFGILAREGGRARQQQEERKLERTRD